MREYLIKDRGGKVTWGKLYYYDHQNRFKVVFREDIDIVKDNPPMYVKEFLKENMYTLDKDFSLMWVKARIIPKERQNIAEILRVNGLSFYREIDMLELCMGRCCFDKMFLERIR